MKKQIPTQPNINIEGSVTGKVVIGDDIIIISHGGEFIFKPKTQSEGFVRPRPSPVNFRPRLHAGFLDRETEIDAAVDALQSGKSVEIYGVNGVGKTSLLRYLSHELEMPSGTIYLPAKGCSLNELTQQLFDCLYESDTFFRLDEVEIRHYLNSPKACVLLDDISLTRGEIEELINIMSGSLFVFVSTEKTGVADVLSIELRGLPQDARMLLFERELGRRMNSKEYRVVKSICTILKGYPLGLLQVASLAREGRNNFDDILKLIEEDLTGKSIFADVVSRLSEPEEDILMLLNSLGALTDGTIKKLASPKNSPDINIALKILRKFGLVQVDNGVYRLTDKAFHFIQDNKVRSDSEETVLSYYDAWSKKDLTPEEIVLESTAILRSLELLKNSQKWEGILQIARDVSGVFILRKSFAALRQIILIAYDASKHKNDIALQAWSLEVLFFCELGLGNRLRARSYLNQMLQLQEESGDKEGAKRTRATLQTVHALKVFLCHSSDDKEAIFELYNRLWEIGFDPWLDKLKLLPGQEWDMEIKEAVKTADVVLVCLSKNSITKEGYVQKEIRIALDYSDYKPDGKLFIIPVRLEDCDVPSRLNKWHWVNLFEKEGYEKLIDALTLRASLLENSR